MSKIVTNQPSSSSNSFTTDWWVIGTPMIATTRWRTISRQCQSPTRTRQLALRLQPTTLRSRTIQLYSDGLRCPLFLAFSGCFSSQLPLSSLFIDVGPMLNYLTTTLYSCTICMYLLNHCSLRAHNGLIL